VDDSTLSVNPANYLENTCADVIRHGRKAFKAVGIAWPSGIAPPTLTRY